MAVRAERLLEPRRVTRNPALRSRCPGPAGLGSVVVLRPGAGPKRFLRADQRLHGRRAAVLILKNRAEMLEQGDWALHAESLTLAAAGGDPPARPTCGSRATPTAARSPAAPCSPATAGPASTAATSAAT